MSQISRNRQANSIDFRIGATIRTLRIVRGLSQQALARELGVSFQQVQKYEKVRSAVSSSRLYEIARILRTPIEVFFDGRNWDRSPREPVRELAVRYDNLSPRFGYREFIEFNQAFLAIPDPAVRKAIAELIVEVAPALPVTETRGATEPALPRSQAPDSTPERNGMTGKAPARSTERRLA